MGTKNVNNFDAEIMINGGKESFGCKFQEFVFNIPICVNFVVIVEFRSLNEVVAF
jgi:hypothetical protein